MPNGVTYDTATLQGVLQNLTYFDPFLLALFFPDVVTFETETIAFDIVEKDLKLAPFVSPLVAGKVQRAQGGAVKTFRPAYLKPKDVVSPNRVFKRRPGEAIGGALSPEARANAIVADILADHRDQILRRLEAQAAEILRTGKTVVSGEDYPTSEVDYGRNAANTIALTGTAKWGEADADPISDIEDWAALAEAPINTLVMDRVAYRNFLKNADVKALLDGDRNSRSQLESGPDNGKLYSYKGNLSGDTEVWVYSGYYHDAAGAKVPFLPTGTVLAASPAVEGIRAFGAIHDAKAGYQALEYFQKNWISEDPAQEFILTQSAPLLIPRRINAVVAATVS
jgi:hypothetical protein